MSNINYNKNHQFLIKKTSEFPTNEKCKKIFIAVPMELFFVVLNAGIESAKLQVFFIYRMEIKMCRHQLLQHSFSVSLSLTVFCVRFVCFSLNFRWLVVFLCMFFIFFFNLTEKFIALSQGK